MKRGHIPTHETVMELAPRLGDVFCATDILSSWPEDLAQPREWTLYNALLKLARLRVLEKTREPGQKTPTYRVLPRPEFTTEHSPLRKEWEAFKAGCHPLFETQTT